MELRFGLWLLGLSFVATGVVRAEPSSTPDVRTLTTVARLEVGGDGHVLDVRPDSSLSPAVADALVQTVRSWRFSVASPGHQPSSGVTFLRVRACVVPDGDQAQLKFKYLGNGPRSLGSPTPMFPAKAYQDGLDGHYRVVYRVQPNGKAIVEDIESVKGGSRADKRFHPAIHRWIEGASYTPEQINGEPVATRLTTTVEFFSSGTFDTLAEAKHHAGKELRVRQGCDATPDALESNRTIALDSPIALVPGT